jgi:hypothetical protein
MSGKSILSAIMKNLDASKFSNCSEGVEEERLVLLNKVKELLNDWGTKKL